MDWQSWVDQGYIAPDNKQCKLAGETIAVAWGFSHDARAQYHMGNLHEADELLREAFLNATRALIQSEGYTPCVDCDFELARMAAMNYFGPTISKDLFAAVDDINQGSGEDDRAIKRGVVASATYTAVVGSRLGLD